MKKIQFSFPVIFLYSGTEVCKPSHRLGPLSRDHFLFHLVLNGRGVFKNPYATSHLQKGQGFLIRPGQRIFYQADERDPWTYGWFGFKGEEAEKILKLIPHDQTTGIYQTRDLRSLKAAFQELAEPPEPSSINKLAKLFQILAILESSAATPDKKSKENAPFESIEGVLIYLQQHFSSKLSLADVAEKAGYTRQHFFKIFKAKLGSSPQAYLIKLRLEKAIDLLRTTNQLISEIASAVGYPNPFFFSRLFKSHFKISPNRWREKNKH